MARPARYVPRPGSRGPTSSWWAVGSRAAFLKASRARELARRAAHQTALERFREAGGTIAQLAPWAPEEKP